MQHYHLIAIGGAVMHYLALHLHRQGHKVTGSDDDIFEPSASRLREAGLHPDALGWHPERIHTGIDAVILGMHAKADNPELLQAQELGLRVVSFPAFIYEQCAHKHRVVVAGSHGKTTITGMIAHVLQACGRKFDYLLGAQLEGFAHMVHLSEDAPLVVIEGDEYPSSPIDLRPKFLHYHHHIGVISGIAWDHINAYPDLDVYVQQFDQFADATPKGGALIFSEDDDFATIVGRKERDDVQRFEYGLPSHEIRDGITILTTPEGAYPLQIFGDHNLRNLNCARIVCNRIGVGNKEFYEAIMRFKGAKNRLEKVWEQNDTRVYRDFAHAPSKVKATVQAVRKQFLGHRLVAVFELHTYSSLNKDFLPEYQRSLAEADEALVCFNPHTLAIKKLPALEPAYVAQCLDHPNLQVWQDTTKLLPWMQTKLQPNTIVLLMSSGHLGGFNPEHLAYRLP
jgi:UDP-N-acetylmuramate: L-alanyl-gamma-D-glutamyl-meso-diaminopimelate ligase